MTAQQGTVRRWWKSRGVRDVRRRLSNLQGLLYPLAGASIRLWSWLCRRVIAHDRRGLLFEYIRDGQPCIVALWHQDVFPLMFELFRFTRDVYPSLFMVSGGRIGRVGTYLLNMYGIECVAGSSAAGGIAAVEELGRRTRAEPKTVFIMADGSRGPAREAKWGALYLARDGGLPIVAARAWPKRAVMLRKTWMRLVLPLPWGRTVHLSGEPIHVPADADKAALEECRRQLEDRLNALVAAGEAYFSEGREAADVCGASIPLSEIRRNR